MSCVLASRRQLFIIVGIIIACIVGIALLVAIFNCVVKYCPLRKRMRERRRAEEDAERRQSLMMTRTGEQQTNSVVTLTRQPTDRRMELRATEPTRQSVPPSYDEVMASDRNDNE